MIQLRSFQIDLYEDVKYVSHIKLFDNCKKKGNIHEEFKLFLRLKSLNFFKVEPLIDQDLIQEEIRHEFEVDDFRNTFFCDHEEILTNLWIKSMKENQEGCNSSLSLISFFEMPDIKSVILGDYFSSLFRTKTINCEFLEFGIDLDESDLFELDEVPTDSPKFPGFNSLIDSQYVNSLSLNRIVYEKEIDIHLINQSNAGQELPPKFKIIGSNIGYPTCSHDAQLQGCALGSQVRQCDT